MLKPICKSSPLLRVTLLSNKLLLSYVFMESSQGFPHSSAGKESACNAGRPQFDSWVGKIRWRRDRLPTPVFLGFPCGSPGKESACNVEDLGLIPGLGRSPGEGVGYPLQYSWASLVAQLGKNLPAMRETWIQSLGWEDPLENGKATHTSLLAWRIPWTIQSLELQRDIDIKIYVKI